MTDWLIDKSALVRVAASPDATEWADRIERGLVRITERDAARSRLLRALGSRPSSCR